MPHALEPQALRSLTERLVAVSSASPDPAGEARCVRTLLESLPRGIESGQWSTPDGRPIAWARVRGGGPRAVLLLGHVDTVAAAGFAGSGPIVDLALDPPRWRDALIAELAAGRLPSDALLRADLEEESRAPGAWMFGRGALDMKSGLAAGAGALAALAADSSGLGGDVLLVATPDEERESAGMLAAVPELRRLRDAEGLELVGALNLDYAEAPVAHLGTVGKALACAWVLGRPTHASAPLRGADAAEIAAHVAAAATTDSALADASAGRRGPPAVVLRLRDLKGGYDLQTALEAVVELNVVTLARPLGETIEALRATATRALARWREQRGALARALGAPAEVLADGDAQVLTYPELVARAGYDPDADPVIALGPGADPRAATLDRLRALAAAAALARPAIVIHLLPPWYPPGRPGTGRLASAARAALAPHGIACEPHYPYVSDASYLSAHGEREDEVQRWLPALGREYRLPFADMAALDLDVVHLGPWGRDAHGLYERVRCDWAFERLPGLIEAVVRRALGDAAR